jgi:hypothetical protein
MNKKKTHPKAGQKNTRVQNTSIAAQLARLIARLEIGQTDTFTVMRELNICRPGARICDLRNRGYTIHTDRITLTDEWGRHHTGVALYTLISQPAEVVAA